MAELTFHYVKGPFHQEIKVDGAYGGVHPTGQSITVSVYTERAPIPKVMVHEAVELPDGSTQLGDEKKELREGRNGMVRTVGATMHMSLEQARALHKWLGDHIKAAAEDPGVIK